MVPISILVEGNLDEAVARKIIKSEGGLVSQVYGRNGVNYIADRIDGFNGLAQGQPILTLVDLMDIDSDCPAEAVEEWLPYRHDQMLLRLVVREIESWILADRSNISSFLGIRKPLIPHHPEDIEDPKSTLVELARSSPKEGLKNAIVPRSDAINDEGISYTGRLQKFVRNQWTPAAAAENSTSLQRCILAVRGIVNMSA